MDRRRTPANGRVAALHLQGRVTADRFTQGAHRQVTGHPWLLAAPHGKRDRQLLWGDDVQVYEERDGWAFVQAQKDGYVGYLDSAPVTSLPATHRVRARTTWAYPAPDFKLPAAEVLHCNAQLAVAGSEGRWSEIRLAGYAVPLFVPTAHLAALDTPESDPAGVAERFLGTPYVWGGNTGFGLDCSGLVQVALHACGIPCPGDSDMQEAEVGETLPDDATPRRGDLYFWKTHVAMAASETMLIHANAFAMAVSLEPIAEALHRIAAQGDGPVTRRARLA